MKIGLIFPYNIFRGGGVQECVLALQKELTKRGHTAKIITPLPRDSHTDQAEGIIFVGTGTDVRSPFHTTAQISVSLDNDLLTRMLDRESFDLLHFHEPWVPIMSRQLLSQSNCINVATFHAKLPETMMSKTIERVITPYTKSVIGNLHALTAVSDSAATYVKTLTDRSISLIPNGIDLDKYTKSTARKVHKNPKILYIGRLEKRKGLIYLIDAFGVYLQKHPGASLLIAGNGGDRDKLEEYARSNNIPNVVFLGFVTDTEKRKLLADSDLFCSPAIYGESFGIVLLEAMACGLPIVAANNPGYKAVMQERGLVSLVDPKDRDMFARRLDLFLHDEQLRKIWQDWAVKYVAQYDYKKVVDQYEKIYSEAKKTKQSAANA
jgi:phosphatidylinositol alpha-mannosyltransferase